MVGYPVIIKILLLIRTLIRILKSSLPSSQDRCETADQFEEVEEFDYDSPENHFIEPPENHCKISLYICPEI